MKPEVAWKATLGELEHQMTKATFNTWLKDTRLADASNGTAVVAVRNDYARQWLDARLRETIERTLSTIAGRDMVIEFVVVEEVIVPNGRHQMEPPPNFEPDDDNLPRRIEPKADNNSSDEIPPDLNLDLSEETGSSPVVLSGDQGSLGPDQASIEIYSSDPTSWYFKVSHYAQRFWRPYLGLIPFSLWELLGSYYFFVRTTNSEWPTIEMLADSLGYGNRYTIFGRAEAKGRKAQEGAIEVLIRERIAYYWTVGKERRVAYKFRVRDNLMMLTPYQVRQLSPRKQVEHAEYIRYFKDFEVEDWEKITAKSAYKDNLREGLPLMSKT